jgi:hypothetical protein
MFPLLKGPPHTLRHERGERFYVDVDAGAVGCGEVSINVLNPDDCPRQEESLLLDWERHAAGGAYQIGRPDFNAVRKLLSLPHAAP